MTFSTLSKSPFEGICVFEGFEGFEGFEVFGFRPLNFTLERFYPYRIVKVPFPKKNAPKLKYVHSKGILRYLSELSRIVKS